MKKMLCLLGLFVVLSACEQTTKSKVKLDAYFDLDSLLDQQILQLNERGVTLLKTVTMDGMAENRTESPDTSGWNEEFIIIRDFNLNKAYYVGSYARLDLEDGFEYHLEDDIKAPVSSFRVTERDGSLAEIQASYFEDKTIFQHKRDLKITFVNQLIKTYQISGYQKMVMKDTIFYTISGEIAYE
ncbi:MAG: hypothetical protein RJQ14_09740 [Marinoscillum sp.]